MKDSNSIVILYVEDDEQVREGYTRTLRRLCSNLILASNGAMGLEYYLKYDPDIIVSDINMPIMNGISMAKEIKKIDLEAMIIFTTAHGESSYLLDAITLQVAGYLMKPVKKSYLVNMVQKLSSDIIIKREHKEQREILQRIIDSKNSLTIITDLTTVSFASQSFLHLFNLNSIDEFNKKYLSILDILSTEHEIINKKSILDALNKDINLYEFFQTIDEVNRVITIDATNKENKSYYLTISEVSSSNFLINLTDITQIQQLQEENAKKAYTDGLTGIYNRYKLKEIFTYESSQIIRYGGILSLALLDIDNFKKFNDTYGHLIGDEVLILLSKKLQKNIRKSDLLVRWGGEEFVILFSHTSLKSAVDSAELLRVEITKIRHPIADGISASFGISSYRKGDSLETLLDRADKALYRAKNSGRDCVRSNL